MFLLCKHVRLTSVFKKHDDDDDEYRDTKKRPIFSKISKHKVAQYFRSSSSILSMHSATRAVSSAYSTSNSWSGIFLHSSLVLRFSCLKILSSTTLKISVCDMMRPCLKLVYKLNISDSSAINSESDASRHNTVQCLQQFHNFIVHSVHWQ